ncbi:type II restriction endonuclease [Idiomarina sp.]|uniref:type II restriction endonuclease n=1 Tax=Idiomarina sp. TaxID=1874361 RepID=UPI001DCE6957|nr:type II restriction endonuclease [Idiomarina sp.]MCJ8317502.1 type II restriction endonuclease [Idiomarina sp.]NQZ17115.1 restriction endonuclease [Idiomarina sp.]
MEFSQWLNSKNSPSHWFFIKRLSANDTGETGGHQVGIYIPEELVRQILKPIDKTDEENPCLSLPARIESHNMPEQIVRTIYYNSKKYKKQKNGRNERRITRWNSDISGSPLQDGDNTGAIAVFSFELDSQSGNAVGIKVWICHDAEEEEVLESLIGEVLPGDLIDERADRLLTGFIPAKQVAKSKLVLPDEWYKSFPSGKEIILFMAAHYRFNTNDPDKLLIQRRREEYKLFLEVEKLHVLDHVKAGFESVDDFISLANSVSNRRKSRSGKSLEIHLEDIFTQKGLSEFGTQCKTEGNKKPDFLFPSCSAYHDDSYSSEKLRMLAVKTTCKDRWRQILNEANKIPVKHLFTLQEGVSVNQFNEMKEENVVLVVPEDIKTKYPESIRANILTLGQFIDDTKSSLA